MKNIKKLTQYLGFLIAIVLMASKKIAQYMGFLMAVLWMATDAACGIWIKASGVDRRDLLFSNFAVAGVLLILAAVAQKTPAPSRRVWKKLGWVFAARCAVGLAATALSYAVQVGCISFSAALLKTSALWLVLGSLAAQLWRTRRLKPGQGRLLMSAGVATTGLLCGSFAATAGKAVCSTNMLWLAILGGALLALVAHLQNQLGELPTLVNTSAYCLVAAVCVAGWSLATGHPVTLPWQGIMLGVLYAVVQVSSQLANQWNAPVAGTIGLAKMLVNTIASVVIFGENPPAGVWLGVGIVMSGLALLGLKFPKNPLPPDKVVRQPTGRY